MSWETLAQISTFGQFFLLLASAILVIWQLKKQVDLARVANTQTQVALASPFNLEIAKDPKLAQLWVVDYEEWRALDAAERESYGAMVIWWLIFYENIFFQKERKLLNDDIFDGWKKDLDVFIEEKHVEEYWKARTEKYTRSLVTYVDKKIEEKVKRRADESQKKFDDDSKKN